MTNVLAQELHVTDSAFIFVFFFLFGSSDAVSSIPYISITSVVEFEGAIDADLYPTTSCGNIISFYCYKFDLIWYCSMKIAKIGSEESILAGFSYVPYQLKTQK